MKCNNCEFRKFHPGGSWWSVAEGNDDPYDYEYCEKGNWCDIPEIPQSKEAEGMEDQWIDCSDFQIKTNIT